MQTDIILRNAAGLMVIRPRGPETFDIVGPPDAVVELMGVLPVLKPTDNPTGVLGDCLTRLLYLGEQEREAQAATEPADLNVPRLRELAKLMVDQTTGDARQTAFDILDLLDN